MEDGSLYDILYKNKSPDLLFKIKSSLKLKFRIILHVAHGMNYLHEKQILHCDICSANILVSLKVIRQFIIN